MPSRSKSSASPKRSVFPPNCSPSVASPAPDRVIKHFHFDAPRARGILNHALPDDFACPRRAAIGRRHSVVLHALVPWCLRQPPLAGGRLRVPSHHSPLVLSRPQLVRWPVDVLAGGGTR